NLAEKEKTIIKLHESFAERERTASKLEADLRAAQGELQAQQQNFARVVAEHAKAVEDLRQQRDEGKRMLAERDRANEKTLDVFTELAGILHTQVSNRATEFPHT